MTLYGGIAPSPVATGEGLEMRAITNGFAPTYNG